MTSNELRKKYLEFFKEKGHAIIPSASLIPENDPSVLFTTAGMHPLVPYLLGEKHPLGTRLADCQKCVRTGDIDEVGDASHGTFFEMLGNWSLGDYFKEDAIKWSWEFLTDKKWLGLDPKKIAMSVFSGDEDAPKDEEAAKIWISLGMPEERIAYLGKEDNWWPAGGKMPGPQGPDTEIFYWIGGSEYPSEDSNPGNDEDNWLEIWNNVFMQYKKTEDGKYEPLAQRNVDTGMGLERTVAVLNGYDDVYRTDTLWPLIEKLEELSGKKYGSRVKPGMTKEAGMTAGEDPSKRSFRIIADHLRAATMIMGDNMGVVPSNLDQGYIVRRLIRRAIRHGKDLGLEKDFCGELAKATIEIFKDIYPEIERNKDLVLSEMSKEEAKFKSTLEQGIKEFEKLLEGFKKAAEKTGRKIAEISGKQAFKLYDTYGFPLEMTMELAKEHDLNVDEKGFNEAFEKHQQTSRAGAEQKFKGGLANSGEETTRLHTATHLLHQALRMVLGGHVAQKGSNITADRLRFDFSHPDKMTPDEIAEVEKIVNEQIEKALPVTIEEMTVEEAKEKGAIGLFEHKYGDKVKVYTIGNEKTGIFSREICGGPHVENTSKLGKFRIKKETSSSAGVRRIKAVLEN